MLIKVVQQNASNNKHKMENIYTYMYIEIVEMMLYAVIRFKHVEEMGRVKLCVKWI